MYPRVTFFLFLWVIRVAVGDGGGASLEIPCNVTSYSLQSHQIYTLTNCTRDDRNPYLLLTPVPDNTSSSISSSISSSSTVENITIHVIGGSVLPSFTAIGASAGGSSGVLHALNIRYTVSSGARVGPFSDSITGVAYQVPAALRVIAMLTIENVTLIIEDSHIDRHFSNFAVGARVVLLAYLSGTQSTLDSSSSLRNIDIRFRNTTVSLLLDGSHGFQSANLIVVSAGMRHSSISDVAVSVMNSTLSVTVDMSQVLAKYIYSFPSLMSVLCEETTAQLNCDASNISFLASGSASRLTVTEYVAANATDPTDNNVMIGSSATVTIVTLSKFSTARNVFISFLQGVFIVAKVLCVRHCDLPFDNGLNAIVVSMTNENQTHTLDGLRIAISAINAVVMAPTTSVLASVSGFLTLQHVVLTMDTSSNIFLNTSGTNGDQSSRSAGILTISGNFNATNLTTIVQDSFVNSTVDNYGCIAVVSALINLVSNVSRATVLVHNVSMIAWTSSSVHTPYTFSFLGVAYVLLTMVASLVNIVPDLKSSTSVGEYLLVEISNSTLNGAHMYNAPAGNSVQSVLSMIAAVESERSLADSTIRVTNVTVLRSTGGARSSLTSSTAVGSSSMDSGGVRVNLTSIVSLFDATNGILATQPSLQILLTFGIFSKGSPVINDNVSTVIASGCQLLFDLDVEPLSEDMAAFVFLPYLSNRSQFMIEDTAFGVVEATPSSPLSASPSSSSLHRRRAPVTFGAIMCAVGKTTVQSSTLLARRLFGAQTLVAALHELLLAGSSTNMTFSDCVLHSNSATTTFSTTTTQNQNGYLIWAASSGSIVFDAATSLSSPFLESESSLASHLAYFHIYRCQFYHYQAVISPGAVNMTASLSSAASHHGQLSLLYFLSLGCNLWDNVVMLPSVIGFESTPLLKRFISYPAEVAFNSSITCPGMEISVTESPTPSNSAGGGGGWQSPHSDVVSSVATSATAGLMYISIVTGGSAADRGAVSTFQRTMTVLRLSFLCQQSQREEQYSSYSSSESSSSTPLFDDAMDNPLLLSISVSGGADDSLNYASGAAIGNVVVTVAISVLLKCVRVLQEFVYLWRRRSHHSSSPSSPTISLILSSLVSIFPSSLPPGSLAVGFGKLAQSSVSACVVLMMAQQQRTTGSIACGIMTMMLWVSFPAYCAYALLWCGRIGPARRHFLLTSEKKVRRYDEKGNKKGKVVAVPLRVITKMMNAISFATFPTEEWTLRDNRISSSTSSPSRRIVEQREYAEFLLENLEEVFEGYVRDREWYFAIEWSFLLISAIVLGAAQALSLSDTADPCAIVQWTTGSSMAVSLLQLSLCVWLKPFSVRLEMWMAIVLSVVEVVCEILILADNSSASDTVASVAALVQLAISIVTLLLTSTFKAVKKMKASNTNQRSHALTARLRHKGQDSAEQQQRRDATASRTLRNGASSIRTSSHRHVTVVEAEKQLRTLIQLIASKRQQQQREKRRNHD